MLKARIAVLVSGGGTNLAAILDACENGIIESGQVVLVVSDNPKAYALKRAEIRGIPTAIMKSEEELCKLLEAKETDMIVLAGFMRILSGEVLRKYESRIINIHPSLIPSFCGKGCYGIHVHEKALAYGVKVTGATVHYVNEIPDGGQIILQKAVEVKEDDTPETLQKRVMEEAEWKLLPAAVEKISREIIKGR